MKEWRASGEPVLAEVGAPFILSLDVAGYRSVRRTLREGVMNDILRPAVILLAACCVGVPGTAEAKCVALNISVSGEIPEDPNAELRVVLTTVPDHNGRDATVERRGTQFSANLWFDATKGYGRLRGHDCSRSPESVKVSLRRGTKVVGSAALSVKTDFEVREQIYYSARSPLILREAAQE